MRRGMTPDDLPRQNPPQIIKTVKDVDTTIPLNSAFSGDLINCPVCNVFLWCLSLDPESRAADMQCWKCKQTWFDVPVDNIDKWFRTKVAKDYDLRDVSLFDYMYNMSNEMKRKIRLLYGAK